MFSFFCTTPSVRLIIVVLSSVKLEQKAQSKWQPPRPQIKLWAWGRTRKLHHLLESRWMFSTHTGHWMREAMSLFVIPGYEAYFHVKCHLWRNLMLQKAQSFQVEWSAARIGNVFFKKKEKEVISSLCYELSLNIRNWGVSWSVKAIKNDKDWKVIRDVG